jgi:hypothetical protein
MYPSLKQFEQQRAEFRAEWQLIEDRARALRLAQRRTQRRLVPELGRLVSMLRNSRVVPDAPGAPCD